MTASATDPVIRLWEGLWIDGDDAIAVELLTDPYVRHTTEVVLDHLSHAGDMTHARFTLTGVNLTTGEPVTIGWLGQYRIEDGRVAESWSMRQTDFSWDS